MVLAPSLEHAALFHHQQFTTVIDVGANLGQFALFPVEPATTNLVCIEPQPNALAHLPQLVDERQCRRHIKEVELSDHSGVEGCCHVTRANDSSSLLRPVRGTGAAPEALFVAYTVDVPVTVGDEVLTGDQSGPVLLKIDVQGSELSVLRGLSVTLESVDSVLVEVSFDELYSNQSRPQDVVELLNVHGLYLAALAGVPGSGSADA